VCNRDAPQEWETFEIIETKDGFNLKSSHGKFVVAEPSGKMEANRDKAGEWELFKMEPNGDATVDVKAEIQLDAGGLVDAATNGGASLLSLSSNVSLGGIFN